LRGKTPGVGGYFFQCKKLYDGGIANQVFLEFLGFMPGALRITGRGAISCLIVLALTYRYHNRSISDWLKRFSLFVFRSPLVLLLILFTLHQNSYSRVWLIRQDCWFCTGSGPRLLVVILYLSHISILGFLFYWAVRFFERRSGSQRRC